MRFQKFWDGMGRDENWSLGWDHFGMEKVFFALGWFGISQITSLLDRTVRRFAGCIETKRLCYVLKSFWRNITWHFAGLFMVTASLVEQISKEVALWFMSLVLSIGAQSSKNNSIKDFKYPFTQRIKE